MAIDLGKFIGRFIDEAREHLGRLDEGLTELETGCADAEGINALFRSAHTVKGSSRMLKLGPINELAHRLEDVLGALREGSLAYRPAVGQALRSGVDAIAAQVDLLAESRDPAALAAPDGALLAALAAVAGKVEAADGEAAAALPPSPPAAVATAPVAAPVATAAAVEAPQAAAPRLKTPDTVRVKLDKLDELIKLMGEVVSSHARLRERVVEIRQLDHDGQALPPAQAARLHRFALDLKEDVLAQEVLMDELHDKALVMRMLPLAIVFEPAARTVRELARSVGKQVECVVGGGEIELDRQIIDRLADPIIHLIRNAVDHGIEAPPARVAAGKPAQGRLMLSARQDGGWVIIELTDDGAGIREALVRDKAVRKGLLSAEQAAALSTQEALDLIFQPGFSTSDIITDLSGRGVGMDVVRQCVVDELQGVIGVDTAAGQGTTFTLRLPLSLAVMRVLLVEADGLSFGFTAQHVAELLRVPQEALIEVAERAAVVLRNEFVPVVPLAGLLGIPAARARSAGRDRLGLLLLVLRVNHEKIAFEVDDLIDEHDMVIKPLPPHLRGLPLVSGMVMTGRNELVSVLHAPALFEAARRQRTPAGGTQVATGEGARPWRVLVVDDSLNTREIEKDVLEAHGYEVALAEDGADGLRKALAGDFDAVLTDVEMPVMDGFTLTARLRESEAYRSRPIIIITSREKEEDKRRGVQVGADAYIVKGDFDQSNLVDTLRTLLG